jgi:DNA-binding transcriptional LysR family regulator
MRISQLPQADLNLLVVCTAAAEERSVSRAATRLLPGQLAVSRALQRLRDMFHDDLLIRTPAGHAPTARGERLLQELTDILPRLDRLLGGSFDPRVEPAASALPCPTMQATRCARPSAVCSSLTAGACPCSSSASARGTFDAMEHGRLDLA